MLVFQVVYQSFSIKLFPYYSILVSLIQEGGRSKKIHMFEQIRNITSYIISRESQARECPSRTDSFKAGYSHGMHRSVVPIARYKAIYDTKGVGFVPIRLESQSPIDELVHIQRTKRLLFGKENPIKRDSN